MKFLIAGFSHETNTFSPVETPLGRFCLDGRNLLGGDAALKLFRGTETCLGGFIAVAERADAAIELPVAAFAPPSRRVRRQAYEAIPEEFLRPLRTTRFDRLMQNGRAAGGGRVCPSGYIQVGDVYFEKKIKRKE